ncbi:hypothetical protein PIROE2DRAFT_8469 [Piromyces sp. E2]|nr:hypothetical protein PIROE2DRAFT_8469 [Piromyces sp. E2]|eukprot:OUM64702.1 hypothetical protein PIROE2DRAFT_8469 [Piromyces sp. E2]
MRGIKYCLFSALLLISKSYEVTINPYRGNGYYIGYIKNKCDGSHSYICKYINSGNYENTRYVKCYGKKGKADDVNAYLDGFNDPFSCGKSDWTSVNNKSGNCYISPKKEEVIISNNPRKRIVQYVSEKNDNITSNDNYNNK